MISAKETLTDGQSIFIFPEGSRTLDGRMGRFKKGGFLMAQELGIPIIPVSISGSYETLRAGARIPHPCRLHLQVHPPIYMSEFALQERPIEAMRDKVAKVIASAVEEEKKYNSSDK